MQVGPGIRTGTVSITITARGRTLPGSGQAASRKLQAPSFKLQA